MIRVAGRYQSDTGLIMAGPVICYVAKQVQDVFTNDMTILALQTGERVIRMLVRLDGGRRTSIEQQNACFCRLCGCGRRVSVTVAVSSAVSLRAVCPRPYSYRLPVVKPLSSQSAKRAAQIES